MESKKINQLATSVAPQTSDLTIIGDPITGVSKKISLLQIANLFATTGTVSSVAVTETGDALTITGSPITTAGTINIGFAGDATQYVRGDGALADFPTSTGGGSSVSYYLNSSVSQGTIGGVAYRELSKDPIAGAGTDITITADGYIASYLTDANDPALLEVPAGNFNCEFYFSVNSNAHNPYVYAEVYKYDGTTFTLIGSSQSVPEYLTSGTTLSPYYFAIPVAQTVLAITDRIAIRIYANVDTREVTLHTENNHLCQVVTTFSKGLTSLNNLTRQVQFLATGTSGTDFNISSSTATHTFNLPVASATNTGKLSSSDWSVFNAKQAALSFTAPLVNTSNTISIPAASASVDGYLDNLDWVKFNTAYNDSIISAAVTGTTTKTLTLNQQDGGTISASWTDDNTDAVTSVFGRTGAVVAVSGDYNTSQVTENTNLYFTDARARAALSFTAGSGAYNSTTGVITIPTNNNQITNGSNFITLTSLSGGTGISYNSTTGVITNSAPDQTVSLTAGAGISISGTYPSFTIASTITQYTDALARASISLTTTGTSGAATYNSTTGVFNIPNYAPDLSGYVPTSRTITINGTSFDLSANRTYSVGTVTSVGLSSATSGVTIGSTPITTSGTITLAIATASGSQNGLLSSTDWTTFNNKQNALTNPVTGTGTTNYLPKFTGASTIGDSVIQEVSSNIGIGVSPSYKLDVNGAAQFRDDIRFSTTNSSIGYTDAIRFVELGVATRMTLSSGNLGLGVTPSAWGSNVKAIQNIKSFWLSSTSRDVYFGTNAYFDNTNYRYIDSSFATSYGQYDGAHIWYQAPSGTAGNAITFTQAMTLFSTGNLAIGTTTDAGFKLDVNGTGRFSSSVTATGVSYITGNSNAGPIPYLQFTDNYGSAGRNWALINGYDNYGTLSFKVSTSIGGNPYTGTSVLSITQSGNVQIGNDTNPFLYIANGGSLDVTSGINWLYGSGLVNGGGIEMAAPSGNSFYMVFKTRNAGSTGERMRITSGGNVLIGTTTDSGYKLDVTGTVRSTGGFFDTSDSRLKILVKDYEQPKGIENVAARMYLKNSRKELGYYAQDVQEILPSAVNEGEDGFLSLSYSQVHTAKIAYLEDKVAQLEELIKKLL
jgi:hypothetical protein